ncbi:MAG TPA: DUF1273 domain-containing protein [Candidatus Avamphibacillus intestinigallinarum]|nr:DUF1273 domain-containing protein [Candidatus Avamphibacillus intestinigallinarum]
MKNVTLTGYKSFELGIFNEEDERIIFIKKAIEKKLLQLIDEGLEWVLISGQYGVELWSGEVVLALKEQGYELKLGVIPPFEQQESRWPEPVQLKYHNVMAAADFSKPLFKGEYKGAFQFSQKNKWLVDKTDGCLMLLDEENHGSVRYFYEIAQEAAEQKGYALHFITPFDLDDAVLELQLEDPDHWSQ